MCAEASTAPAEKPSRKPALQSQRSNSSDRDLPLDHVPRLLSSIGALERGIANSSGLLLDYSCEP
jgi:hypothetical protein